MKLLERQISKSASFLPVFMWTGVEFPSYAPAVTFQARMLGDVVAEYAGTARS